MQGEFTNYFKILLMEGQEAFYRALEESECRLKSEEPKPDLIYKNPQTGEIVELYDPFDPRRYQQNEEQL